MTHEEKITPNDMRISIVAAMSLGRVIGNNGRLPWPRFRKDLARFQKLTLGKTVLMGRLTYESIGRLALPGRKNLVMTRSRRYGTTGIIAMSSLGSAIDLAKADGVEELMVIGGSYVFDGLSEIADRMYLTHIYKRFEGDVLFPEFDASQWRETEHTFVPDDGTVDFKYSFVTLDKIHV
jgi:dihydrofolate reductase